MNGNQNKESKLEDVLSSVSKGQNELLDILRKDKSKMKSKQEIICDIVRTTFTALIPIIGIIFTYLFNTSQNERNNELQKQHIKIARIQTLEKFMPHLMTDNEKSKSVALLSISALGEDELAVTVAELVGGSGARLALAKIAISAPTEKGRNAAKQSIEKGDNLAINRMIEAKDGEEIYLGTPHNVYLVTEDRLKLFPEEKFKQSSEEDAFITMLGVDRNGNILAGTSTVSANAETQSFYLIKDDTVHSVPNFQITIGRDGVATYVPENEIEK